MTNATGIDVRSFEPYYEQLKRILIRDIEANRAEGDLLPSESEMCRTYAVSRTVVRQALGDLENEGLVLKVKGKGTYVTGRKLNTSFVQHSLGFYESMQKAGHVVRSKTLALRTEHCGVSMAKLRTVLPARLFPGLADMDMTDKSLYQVLASEYGIRPASGHRAIDATALSSEDAHHLRAPAGQPALRIESITRSAEGVLFEYYVAIYRGDTFKFELEVTSP